MTDTYTTAAVESKIVVVATDLTILANKIKAAHAGVRDGFQHAVKAGLYLIQAKRLVRHGEWLPWLENHCEVSERTARAYMQLAKMPDGVLLIGDHRVDQNGNAVADLSFRQAIKKVAKPKASKSTVAAEIVKPDDVEASAAQRKAEAAADEVPEAGNPISKAWRHASEEQRAEFATTFQNDVYQYADFPRFLDRRVPAASAA
jgi:hypothetical protein